MKKHIVETGSDKKYGARPLRRAVQSQLEDKLAEALLNGEIKRGDHVEAGISKKEIKLVTPSISSKQINSETSFDETSDLTEFGKELSKIENPIISFAFNVPQNIDREKSQLTLTLKEITSSKEYTVVYNRVDGVMLHNGENTFELTIKDQYGNKRIIKNTIVIN